MRVVVCFDIQVDQACNLEGETNYLLYLLDDPPRNRTQYINHQVNIFAIHSGDRNRPENH